jgi:hypothetical protein
MLSLIYDYRKLKIIGVEGKELDEKRGQNAHYLSHSVSGRLLILETAVVSTHLTQPLDSPSIRVKTLITNKVTAIFTMTLGKPIACAMHALPTAVSRLIIGQGGPVTPDLVEGDLTVGKQAGGGAVCIESGTLDQPDWVAIATAGVTTADIDIICCINCGGGGTGGEQAFVVQQVVEFTFIDVGWVGHKSSPFKFFLF